jgi:hypothetical protein
LLSNFLVHVWIAVDNWKSLIIQAWSPWIVICMFYKHAHKQFLFEFVTLVSIAMEILRIWNLLHLIPLTLSLLAELSFHVKNRLQSLRLTPEHVESNLKLVVYTCGMLSWLCSNNFLGYEVSYRRCTLTCYDMALAHKSWSVCRFGCIKILILVLPLTKTENCRIFLCRKSVNLCQFVGVVDSKLTCLQNLILILPKFAFWTCEILINTLQEIWYIFYSKQAIC